MNTEYYKRDTNTKPIEWFAKKETGQVARIDASQTGRAVGYKKIIDSNKVPDDARKIPEHGVPTKVHRELHSILEE